MRELVFEMEKYIYQQKAISDLLAMLVYTTENGVAISDFKEGVFYIYKTAFETHKEIATVWEKMMNMVTENN